MTVTFNSVFDTIPLEEGIRSIFDQNIAGQFATDGKYYCIHRDHKTAEYYAISKEAELLASSYGRLLDAGEEAEFHREKVRGMTSVEESLYNVDALTALVDLWGNVSVDA